MKKELSLLLQFFSIVLLVGYGFFGIMLLQSMTTMSLWSEYKDFFTNWILAFLVLTSIRLAVIYLISTPSIITVSSENKSYIIEKEVWATVHYLAIAVVSILFSFLIPFILKNNENLSINLVELWLGFKKIFLSWLTGFLALSFIRISIIYLRKAK